MSNIYEFLQQHDIAYKRYDHSPIFTCEEAEELGLDFPGQDTKNLFVRNKKKSRIVLVVVGHEKQVDLPMLAKELGEKRLSFGSADLLHECLGVLPGSVTLLGAMNDIGHRVEIVIDTPLWDAEILLCHPLTNTATLGISHKDIETFFRATGHAVKVLDVPALH